MSVDQTGKIVTIKSDDDNPNDTEKKSEGDMMGNMLQQFAGGMELPKEGEAFPLQVKTGASLAKGQSWTDSISGIETGSTKYTVTDVTASDVLIDYVSESTAKRKQEVGGGVEMDINLKNTMTGKITLDKKSGLLKQKTMEGLGVGTMDVMGQKVPMKTKINGTITVTGF
jgi:hypothetical protein